MPSFEVQTVLCVSPKRLASDLLTMEGVNYELAPYLRMSAPDAWKSTSLEEWPVGTELFASTIFAFGFLPIDRHRFTLQSASGAGFQESSKSLMNNVWTHKRFILEAGSGSIVKDVVRYESKFSAFGNSLRPVYRSVFVHRHKRLKRKYAR